MDCHLLDYKMTFRHFGKVTVAYRNPLHETETQTKNVTAAINFS